MGRTKVKVGSEGKKDRKVNKKKAKSKVRNRREGRGGK